MSLHLPSLFSLPIILADIPLLNIVFLFAPTWIVVLLAGGELFWLSQVRAAHASPDTVVLRRSLWPILIPTVILFLCNAAPLLGQLSGEGKTLSLLLGFIAFIVACTGLVKFPVVFIADQTGLTRSIPFFSRTLPWSAIDWLYIKQTTMVYRSPIGLGRASDQHLMVEAGPRQKLAISLRPRRTPVKPATLQHIIQERSVNALVGYDKQSEVQSRRASMANALVR